MKTNVNENVILMEFPMGLPLGIANRITNGNFTSEEL